MKRYLLFSGEQYVGTIGWECFVGDFKLVSHAEEIIKAHPENIFQLVDISLPADKALLFNGFGSEFARGKHLPKLAPWERRGAEACLWKRGWE